MPKENLAKSNSAEPCVPITRARNGATTCTEQSKEQVHKVVALPCNAKRAAALDENNNDNAPLIPCNQHKKRAVLKDVTNVSCGNPHKKRAVLKDISNVSCGNPPKKSLNATNLPVCFLSTAYFYFSVILFRIHLKCCFSGFCFRHFLIRRTKNMA